MPAFLRSAVQILFTEDSSKLLVASNQGSLHIIQLVEGDFKHLHTFQPQSGRSFLTGQRGDFLVSQM
jgi:U3 small nucleolar RNA-associated protein 4